MVSTWLGNFYGLIANDLNMRVESIQQGYPDYTAIRYVGRGKWERVNIEFEFKSSNFDHDPEKCDVLVCWEDALTEGKRNLIKGLEIIELKSILDTPQVPNVKPKIPEENIDKTSEYDLDYHFKLKNVNKEMREMVITTRFELLPIGVDNEKISYDFDNLVSFDNFTGYIN